MKPVIGITGSVFIREQGMFAGTERAFVNNDYVKAVIAGGGIPVILPIIDDEEVIKLNMNCINGIIFSGGADLGPHYYGEEPLPKLGEVNPNRDEYEFKLIKAAYEAQKPILGICRGIQLINVAFGGSLYQDLEAQLPDKVFKHFQEARNDVKTHTVEIAENTLLADILALQTIQTNSFHHQAVKDVAPGFIISAKAKDGIIEAIEKPGRQFVLGVQWHPEGMFSKHQEMSRIFKRLVEAANK